MVEAVSSYTGIADPVSWTRYRSRPGQGAWGRLLRGIGIGEGEHVRLSLCVPFCARKHATGPAPSDLLGSERRAAVTGPQSRNLIRQLADKVVRYRRHRP